MHTPYLTTDWFTQNIPHIKTHLQSFVNKPDICLLEVGTFEGRSALWFLENILTHDTARIICVDPAVNLPEKRLDQLYGNKPEDRPHANEDMAKRIQHNLLDSPYGYKVRWIREHSQDGLKQIPNESIDIAYIDGNHNARQVLSDVIMTWNIVKVGGVLICDDYMLTFPNNTTKGPGPAIDAFLDIFNDKAEVIHKEYQIIIRKTGSLP